MRTIIDFLRHEYPSVFTLNDIAYEMGYTTDEVCTMIMCYRDGNEILFVSTPLYNGVAATRPLTGDEAAIYDDSDVITWIDDEEDSVSYG